VAESSGAKTQLTGVVGAIAIGIEMGFAEMKGPVKDNTA
jgi:hypothetical protein